MIIVKSEEVKPFWTKPPYQREIKEFLSPKTREISKDIALGIVTLPPGESGNVHMHERSQETWFIISGKGKLMIGSEEIRLMPDMVVVAPVGIEHQIANDGNELLKAIFIFTPAGPEEEFVIE